MEWIGYGKIDTTLGSYVNNNTSDSSVSPEVLFDTCGTFLIKQLYLLSDNCNDTIGKFVTVWCLPQASFISDSVCFGDTTTLTKVHLLQETIILSGDITLGVGTLQMKNNDTISNVFSICNDTNVSLVVTDINDAKILLKEQLSVHCNPNADYNVADEQVLIMNSSQ